MKTSPKQTSPSGAAKSPCSQAAFLVSPSVMPGDEQARKMTATSGRICSAALTKSSPITSLLRTLLESSRWSEQGEVSEVASTADLFDTGDRVRGYRLRETFTLQRICDDLESHGYTVQPVLIPACAVGACHRRNRIFIIGRRNSRIQQNSHQDTLCMGLQRKDEELGNIKRQRNARTNGSRRHIAKNIGFRTKWTGKGWRPTVPPVHRGNDGLPFDVDDLTLPFGKWRTEALKAYGNAIVPQVMYEIFRAIDQIERN